MAVSRGLDGVPADVDDGHEDGGQLGAHGAEAVTGQQREGEARLAGDDAHRDGDEAEEYIADKRGIDDVLEVEPDGQGPARHHRDDDKDEARPDYRQAYVALAFALRDGGEGKFAVLRGCFGLFVFVHFSDLPRFIEKYLLVPSRPAAVSGGNPEAAKAPHDEVFAACAARSVH